jgi:LSD1 subclass zinc finger protein
MQLGRDTVHPTATSAWVPGSWRRPLLAGRGARKGDTRCSACPTASRGSSPFS